jgi:hypothetical protein
MQTFKGSIGRAWLDGEATTEELHEHMSDPEYLRALQYRYPEYDDRHRDRKSPQAPRTDGRR